jgi:hypothetical protein
LILLRRKAQKQSHSGIRRTTRGTTPLLIGNIFRTSSHTQCLSC